jgi:hypothetical protein
MTAETTDFAVKGRRPIYRDLSVQILIAMALGILIGSVWPSSADL